MTRESIENGFLMFAGFAYAPESESGYPEHVDSWTAESHTLAQSIISDCLAQMTRRDVAEYLHNVTTHIDFGHCRWAHLGADIAAECGGSGTGFSDRTELNTRARNAMAEACRRVCRDLHVTVTDGVGELSK